MPGVTQAYHIVLRPTHPHEAALIADLAGYPTGRRARRIRELLLHGIVLAPVPVPWRAGSTTAAAGPRLRIAVYVHSDAREDAPLRQAVASVHPAHVGDYLKEALAAGLLVREAAPAPPPAAVTPAVSASALPATRATAPPSLTPASPPRPVEIDFVIDEPAPAMPTPPDEEPPPPAGRKKRPELMSLMFAGGGTTGMTAARAEAAFAAETAARKAQLAGGD